MRERIGKALDIFIQAFRLYIITKITSHAGSDKWAEAYRAALSEKDRAFWDRDIKAGTKPEMLIDWTHLRFFAINYKAIIKEEFARKTNSLPTWIDEIVEVRNDWAHSKESNEEDVDRAFGNMIRIFQLLKMTEAEEKIRELRGNSSIAKTKPTQKSNSSRTSEPAVVVNSNLIPWFRNVRPHKDIQQGKLDESVFAANLMEVQIGRGREIYTDRDKFFEKTYFTAGLKNIARRVISGLNGGQDSENRVVSLQTGFGGGKTHSLISLYHIVKGGKKAVDSVYLTDLFEYAGKPSFDKASVAVFTNTSNDPAQGRMTEKGLHIQTLWGEIAYQLGGNEAYNLVKQNDLSRTAPKGIFRKVLEKTKPALILIDELADYCVAASGITVGGSTLSDQTVSFMQELSETVAGTDNCVLVVTLPASVAEVAASPKAQQILNSLSSRLSRVSADTRPVADDEIYEVIRRRLFEDLGDEKEIEKVIESYSGLYKQLVFNHEISGEASKPSYKAKIRNAYPFHPELIDIFKNRWASYHDFQRTRGVLRLLASIVADLWKRQNNLTGVHALIHTSDVNFDSIDSMSAQVKKFGGNGYDAVISADISGTGSNAFKVDFDNNLWNQFSLAQGICSTVLMGTFDQSSTNKGMSISDIKLCIVKPDSFNHNTVNSVIDSLESNAHYLYYATLGANGKHYWFHTEPNLNILINQLKQDIKSAEINAEILRMINKKTENISLFSVLVSPAADVPEQKRLALVILSPDFVLHNGDIPGNVKKLVTKLAVKKGDSDRIYRNTMLFLTSTEAGMGQLNSDIREYLACRRIKDDYQSQLGVQQREDIKAKVLDLQKQCEKSLSISYSVILKYSAKNGIERLNIKQFKDSLDIQINSHVITQLKDEDWILESVGAEVLKTANLFPDENHPVRVKDVYEAFIRFDDKPMITDIQAISSSIERYCTNGTFAVACGELGNFTKIYYKQTVPYFDVTDNSYWLVDKSLYKPEDTSKPAAYQSCTANVSAGSSTESGSQSQPVAGAPKQLKSIVISGKVDMANYHQLFSSFIMPLAQNSVEIEIKIKGKSTSAKPLTENSDQYKITKESAKQLGLKFEEEI